MKNVYALLMALLVVAVAIPVQAQSTEEVITSEPGLEITETEYQFLAPVFTGTSWHENAGKSASLITNRETVAYEEERGISKRWFIIIGVAAVTTAGAYFIFRDTGSEPSIPMPPTRPN